jgi:hypothetical protein
MDRRQFLAGALSLPGISHLSAPKPDGRPPPLVVTEADAGKTLTATLGQAISVQLVGDQARTGWEASAVEGAVLRQGHRPGERGVAQECQFTPAADAKNPEAGTYAFEYIAATKGSSELRFVYVSPGGPKPMTRSATKLVRVFKMVIKVGP